MSTLRPQRPHQFTNETSAVQLLVTAALSAVSLLSSGYQGWIQENKWMVWISVCLVPFLFFYGNISRSIYILPSDVGQLFGAIAFMLLTYWKRKSYPANIIFLACFTGLEAYSISVIVSLYDAGTVLRAVFLTAGLFVGLTLFACQTKYDFTSWVPYLFGGLWALILFGFMASFFPANNTTELAYSSIAALIFSAYILVDTQLILKHYHVEEEIAVYTPFLRFSYIRHIADFCAFP